MGFKQATRAIRRPFLHWPPGGGVRPLARRKTTQELSVQWPNLRWNFRMGVANGVFFSLHDALINPSIVLVAFLAQLTDNPIILGTTAPLWGAGLMIPQFWVSLRVQGRAHLLPIYKMMSLIRVVMWLALVLVTFLSEDPTALILTLLAFMVIYPITWGVAAISFSDVVGKTIPPRRRGIFFSWRMALGGVLAVGGSLYVKFILSPESGVEFANNFGMIFAAAAIVTILGLLPFHMIREPAARREPALPGWRAHLATARDIWHGNPEYRRLVTARIALLLATGTAPLVLGYAKRVFNLPLEAVPTLVFADTTTRLIVVVACGWFSRTYGDRALVRAAVLFGCAAFGLLLAAPLHLAAGAVLPYFTLVIILFTTCTSALSVGLFALNMNIALPAKFPLYVGLSNTVAGIAMYLSAMQGAVVGVIGYAGLFLLALLLLVTGWWMLNRVAEPAGDG